MSFLILELLQLFFLWRYKNTFAAFYEIFATEGIRGLYVGIGPTVKRAAILTATQVRILKTLVRHIVCDGMITTKTQGAELLCNMPHVEDYCCSWFALFYGKLKVKMRASGLWDGALDGMGAWDALLSRGVSKVPPLCFCHCLPYAPRVLTGYTLVHDGSM